MRIAADGIGETGNLALNLILVVPF